jgi:hypothetical protein
MVEGGRHEGDRTVSFNLIEVQRLQVMGGAVLAKYERLLGEADRALHDSPAVRELGQFMKDFEQDPNLAAEVARNEDAAAWAAAERAARGE